MEKIEDPARLKNVFDGLVADLGSNDFAVRQRASGRLNADEQFGLGLLEAALKRQDLTLEARTRLAATARQRFFHSSRAALGFQFGLHMRDRIVVGTLFPKFPAFGMLEEGDMIVGADGFKLEGPGAKTLLQAIIVSHDPGENLQLVVRRGARKLDLSVPLGRFDELPEQGPVFIDERLSRAWRIRAQSRLRVIVEPIRIDPAPESWGPSDDAARRKADRMLMRETNEAPLTLVGGGTPRALRGDDESRLFDPAARPQFVMVGGQPRVVNMPFARGGFAGNFDPDAGLPTLDPKKEYAMLLDDRMACDRQLGGVNPLALDPNDPRHKQLMELRKSRDLITKQMDALQAEMDEAKPGDGKRSSAEAPAP